MKVRYKFLRKKSVRVTLLLLLFLFFSSFFYIFTIFLDAKKRVSEVKMYQASFSSNSHFEKESMTYKEDLDYFLLFSAKSDIKDKISLSKNFYNITDDFDLEITQENKCTEFRCLSFDLSFEEIPSSLWRGLMGIEDIRFLEHSGVDLYSIFRAIIVDIKTLSFSQGASTLTQQLVKNIFLTSKKSLNRKFKELIYAIYLDSVLEKEEIIAWYFNEVYWGTFQGVKIYGVMAASIAYFSKKPEELTPFEVTILISLLKGPSYYSPLHHLDRLESRVSYSFKKLKEKGFIIPAEKPWKREDFEKFRNDFSERNKKSYFRNFSILSKDKNNYLSLFEKFVLLESKEKFFKNLNKSIKNQDVALKAYIIDRNCKEGCEKYFSYYSKEERDQEDAIATEKHQVGSTIKPFSYEVFLKSGYDWDDEVSLESITLKLKSGKWTPKNSHKLDVDSVTLKRALQESLNTPLIRLASSVGFSKIEEFMKPYFKDLLIPLKEYPAQLLGSIEVSVKDYAEIYKKYLNDVCEDVLRGKISFKKTVPYILTEQDKTTIRNIAYKRMKAFRFFGKTGTSNNGFDNWYVAADASRVYVIWFGLETGRQDAKLRISGATSSFRLFQDLYLYSGKQVSDFTCPSSL